MASLPPPRTDRSPRRGLQLKEGTKLPDPPSFEKVSTKSEVSAEASASTRPLPEQERTDPVEPKPDLEAAAVHEPQDKQTRRAGPTGSWRSLTRGQGDTPSEAEEAPRDAAPAAAGDTKFVTIRLGFEPNVRELANKCCQATGAALPDLVGVAARKMIVTDADFEAKPLWPAPTRARAIDYTLRVKCKLSSSLLSKWSKKLDPLGVKQPGEIAYNAVQHAFNRSARRIISDLMKAQ